MRRILTAVAAAAAVTAIAAAPASANGHKPAGTIVDVAVQASGGAPSGQQPVRLRPAGAGRRSPLGSPPSLGRPEGFASPFSRPTTGRSCSLSPTSAARTRPAKGSAGTPPSPHSASTRSGTCSSTTRSPGKVLNPIQVLLSPVTDHGQRRHGAGARHQPSRRDVTTLKDPKLVLVGP